MNLCRRTVLRALRLLIAGLRLFLAGPLAWLGAGLLRLAGSTDRLRLLLVKAEAVRRDRAAAEAASNHNRLMKFAEARGLFALLHFGLDSLAPDRNRCPVCARHLSGPERAGLKLLGDARGEELILDCIAARAARAQAGQASTQRPQSNAEAAEADPVVARGTPPLSSAPSAPSAASALNAPAVTAPTIHEAIAEHREATELANRPEQIALAGGLAEAQAELDGIVRGIHHATKQCTFEARERQAAEVMAGAVAL